jgi:4-hydroxy-tetrahydrodipicolinate synthase
MKHQIKHQGVVVPMVTPLTRRGELDEQAAERLVQQFLDAKVNAVFVLGTTGEGGSISSAVRQRLVERVVAQVGARALVYAGIGDRRGDDAAIGNRYLEAGADAIVARCPVSMVVEELEPWFISLATRLNGPMILYNIPILTGVSIPLELVDRLMTHSSLVGIKDSENNGERLTALLMRFGNRSGFSIFVGVGKLMEQGLRLGAHGIVPSVGNLIPQTCRQLWECAQRRDWDGARLAAERMDAVASLYQADRNLGESLSALKGALSLRQLCQPYMSPPLEPMTESQLKLLAVEMDRLQLSGAASLASTQRSTAHHSFL